MTLVWAYVVTEKQTDINPDTDTDSDLPERRRDEMSQEPQSGFVSQIHSMMKGLDYMDDTHPGGRIDIDTSISNCWSGQRQQ